VAGRTLVVLAATAALACCGTADDPSAQTTATYVLDLHSGAQGEDTAATPAVGPLEPGPYAPTVFEPAMRFQVGEGWALAYETQEHILLFVGDPELPGSIYVFGVSSKTKVTPTPVAEADDTAPASEPFPADYEAWLRAVPHLDVGPRRATEIGGAPGFAVDVDLSGLPTGRCMSADSRQQCFYPVETSAFTAMPGVTIMTVHVVDVDGSTVLVFTDGDRYRDEVASVLESIRWEAG
jgi:hypothetical protein